MRNGLIKILILILWLTTLKLCEAAIEPQHEFEKPGYNPGHAYDGIIPEETIDLFSGGLQISQRDIPAQNITGFDAFSKLLTRTYSSKIYRQVISPSCTPFGNLVEDDSIGLGWSLHFGRLWEPGTANPALELPDGSRHLFYADTVIPTRKISKSMWILEQGSNFYDACSPGPEQVCLRFPTSTTYTDTRGGPPGRLVSHASDWYLYHPSGYASAVKTTFSYEKFSGLIRPTQVTRACSSALITFIYSGAALDKIQYVFQGLTRIYDYTVITQGSVKLLDSVKSPEGKTYKYIYDSTTKELTRITISSDSTIGDSDDLDIDYTYQSQTFYVNPLFIDNACGRVVSSKKVTFADGSNDTWTYQIVTNSSSHITTVTDPRGNKRVVQFQGYGGIGNAVWKVGSILRDESFQGCCTSIVAQESTYLPGLVSSVSDPEAHDLDQMKIPLQTQSKTIHSQTGQDASVIISGHDRYGNPALKTEENFDHTTLRKTSYKYAHSDGLNGDDTTLEDKNFIRAVSEEKVLNPSNQVVNELDYTYFNSVGSSSFGLLNTSTLSNNEAGVGNVVKNFSFDSNRQLSQISEQMESGARTTSYVVQCGLVTDVNDSLTSTAGLIFDASVDTQKEVYTNTANANAFLTSYSYDDDKRLTFVDPPSGDSISILYNDSTKIVTILQGTASTTEIYDEYGRLKERQVKLTGVDSSRQTFSYDEIGNVIQESEKALNSTPVFNVSKTYDALNRVTSVSTVDGVTNYLYTGPDVKVQVNSELGVLTTEYIYDAANRLTKVKEPNGTITTYQYDEMDRLIRVDQPTQVRRFFYSSRGKLTSEIHPESGTTSYTYFRLGQMKSKTRQSMGAIQYTYDIRDRLKIINYPSDSDITFYYDGASVPGFTSQTYTNKKSHLTGMSDAAGTSTTIWPSFSSLDQTLKRDLYLNGITGAISLQYTYDSRGNLDSIQYPSGQTILIPRNDGNAISEITRTFSGLPDKDLLSSVSYNAVLLPKSLAYGNGMTVSISSDPRNRPDILQATVASLTKLSLDYRYNQRGLIDQIGTSQNGSAAQNRVLSYDNLGRIKTFQHSTSTLTYSYDNLGNLLSKSAPLGGSYNYVNNQITTISYSPPGSQLEVSPNGKRLEYDNDNRVKRVYDPAAPNVTDFRYIYDGHGNRIISQNFNIPEETKYFLYDEQGTLLSEISKYSSASFAVDKDYVNGPTGTVATIRYDQAPRKITAYNVTGSARVRIHWKDFYNTCRIAGVRIYGSTSSSGPFDLLNPSCPNTSYFYDDVNVQPGVQYFYKLRTVYTDGSESPDSVIVAHTYSTSAINQDGPFNNYTSAPIYYQVNDHLGTARIITNESGAVTGSFEYYPFGEVKSESGCLGGNERFTGKLLDQESGLQYFGARYLSNTLIRFVSVDPSALSFTPENPQSWNRYTYSLNNPVTKLDPNGEAAADVYEWFAGGAARLSAESSSSGSVTVDFLGNTVADLGLGLVSPLNIGTATGSAISEYGGVGDADANLRIAAAAAGDTGNAILTGLGLYGSVSGFLPKSGPYSHIPDHPSVGPGKDFTASQKGKFYAANRAKNSGAIRSDKSGKEVTRGKRHTKGVTPPESEAQVDHIVPKSKGGTNSGKNAQILSRKENLDKKNN